MLVGRVMGDMVVLPMADLLLLNGAAKGCTSNPLLRLGINGSVKLCLPPVLAPRVLDEEGHAGGDGDGEGELERDGEVWVEWMGCEERENPSWVTEGPVHSMAIAMPYRLGMIFR
jgi:hypothetical protein